MMTAVKKALKALMVIIMFVGITISVTNLLSTESQAKWIEDEGEGNNGTSIVNPDGSFDCQGAPLDC